MSSKHNKCVRKEIDLLLEAGIISPSASAWPFSIVIALREGGGARFCADYRELNRVIKADR